MASFRQSRVFRVCWRAVLGSGLTVLLSLSWKLNGSELTEILESGITESKYCQITVLSPSRALLRGNEVLDAWWQHKISNRLYRGIWSFQTLNQVQELFKSIQCFVLQEKAWQMPTDICPCKGCTAHKSASQVGSNRAAVAPDAMQSSRSSSPTQPQEAFLKGIC